MYAIPVSEMGNFKWLIDLTGSGTNNVLYCMPFPAPLLPSYILVNYQTSSGP